MFWVTDAVHAPALVTWLDLLMLIMYLRGCDAPHQLTPLFLRKIAKKSRSIDIDIKTVNVSNGFSRY
jgi:hypothetical protein